MIRNSMRNTTKTFKALSDPNRIRILKILETKPLCVCEIKYILNLATSTVSKHLSILRDAGFIEYEKDGKWVNYRINENQWNRYSAEILPLMEDWLNDDEQILSDRKKVEVVDRYDIDEV